MARQRKEKRSRAYAEKVKAGVRPLRYSPEYYAWHRAAVEQRPRHTIDDLARAHTVAAAREFGRMPGGRHAAPPMFAVEPIPAAA